MTYTRWLCMFLSSPLLLYPMSEEQTESKICESIHNLNSFSIRHIESKGIGYNKGYTTIEGFFVPLPSLSTNWIPFLDIRGHIFNNAKPAANAGMGVRYIGDRVWGTNIYYDYRKTSRHTYNQVSFGFESLSRYLDYRVNGYFPVGSDKSSLYGAHFHKFSGNSLYIAQKQQRALKGFNGELGIHISKIKEIDFYTALGPYYFGNGHKHTFGGQFRLVINVLNILNLEGNTSYDHLYKWIGQGQISLSYAFTPKTADRKQKKRSCSYNTMLLDRALQNVDKQEIIVITTQEEKSQAINPETGAPYRFFFVDNTSHSQGTWESPFNTLLNAQNASSVNDIIVVLPGDGTDKGMNSGITLKDGQKLFGGGIKHSVSTTLGDISIPSLAEGLPLITNQASGTDVITCGNNNQIKGVIASDNHGTNAIFINGKSGAFEISNNILSTINDGNGIQTTGVGTGTIVIAGNTFIAKDQTSQTFGIWRTGGGLSKYIINGNLFTGANETTGFCAGMDLAQDISSFQAFIIKNIFNSQSNINGSLTSRAIGLGISNNPSFPAQCLVEDNTIIISPGMTNPVAGIRVSTNNSTTAPIEATLRHNRVNTARPDIPGYLFRNVSSNPSQLQLYFAPDNMGTSLFQGP